VIYLTLAIYIILHGHAFNSIACFPYVSSAHKVYTQMDDGCEEPLMCGVDPKERKRAKSAVLVAKVHR